MDDTTTEKDVPTLLAELYTEAERLRAQTIEVERKVVALRGGIECTARDVAGWISVFLDEDVMISLGANLDLANASLARAHGLQQFLSSVSVAAFGAFSKVSPSNIARMADALAAGMAQNALACTCGYCATCKLVDQRGSEVAAPEVLRRMRDSITTLRDTVTRGSGRIHLAKH
jgi:hypothetical protein